MSKRLLSLTSNKILHISKRLSTIPKQTPAEYCLNLVRKNDYENFLCTLLLPRETRAAAMAIRAFNVEVAQVEDQVQDNNIGRMRMKFWLQALDDIYKGIPPRSPVTLELHRILQRHNLTKRYFKRLIDIRLERLSNITFMNMEAIERYAEYSTSSIYYLLVETCGVNNVNADHAASHIGKAHGITTLIRSIPYNSRKRVNIMPQDILLKHGVSTESILQGQSSPSLQDAICDVASNGKLHLNTANSLMGKLEKKLHVFFLPRICVEHYLNELEKSDFNVFHPRLQKRNSFLPLRILWNKFWIR